MDLFLTQTLVLVPTIGFVALLIGLPVVAASRKRRRSQSQLMDDDRPGAVSATTARRVPPTAMDFQLTTVLAESGEILLGYRTCDARAASQRTSTGDSPLTTGTLLLVPIDQEACDTVVSTLDRWSTEGVEVALRSVDRSDVVVLSDRRTLQRLVLSHVRAPRD